jgi:methylated-DNA-[protein]-cysteine S-methyltransferase
MTRMDQTKTRSVELKLDRVGSPIGAILIVCEGDALCSLEFAEHERRMAALLLARYGEYRYVETADPGGVSSCVRAYLGGALDAVANLQVSWGGTAFQGRVWSALREISPGEVLTYRALAERLGVQNAVRAVGHAVALNPVNIAVPCHRVVGACGTLRGYSGGLERKRWLLEHEGVDCQPVALRQRLRQSTARCKMPVAEHKGV